MYKKILVLSLLLQSCYNQRICGFREEVITTHYHKIKTKHCYRFTKHNTNQYFKWLYFIPVKEKLR